MARFLQSFRRSVLITRRFLFSESQLPLSRETNRPISSFLPSQTRTHSSSLTTHKSPFESNILRILQNEIQYQIDYGLPKQPVPEFNTFSVEDRPGEQWITLRSNFGEHESIKIEATMFDGGFLVPKSGDDSTEEDLVLHISLLVDISKADGGDKLEFVISAWPDRLEIQKAYVFGCDGFGPQHYMGPNFGDLDNNFQSALLKYLEERGVNNELSVFIHQFMTNKDRIELIRWLRNVKSLVEM